MPSRLLTHPPSQLLLDELRARQVQIDFGDCIIEADAGAAPKILESIRKLELPLVLQFNHSRVMVLPQGINKATGLREALNTLRLSLHNCVGIGDAENDYAMLDACELGVAVSWGSKRCKALRMKFCREQDRGMSLLTFAKLVLTSNYRLIVRIADALLSVTMATARRLRPPFTGGIS